MIFLMNARKLMFMVTCDKLLTVYISGGRNSLMVLKMATKTAACGSFTVFPVHGYSLTILQKSKDVRSLSMSSGLWIVTIISMIYSEVPKSFVFQIECNT